MADPGPEQTQVVANKANHLIFFTENDNNSIVYNYKTRQWTLLNLYQTLGPPINYFTINNLDATVGICRYSAGSVDLQIQTSSGAKQPGVFASTVLEPNFGGRTAVMGLRPLAVTNYPTVTSTRCQFSSKELIGDEWGTQTQQDIDYRTAVANIREEGRFVRVGCSLSDDWTLALGIDIEWYPKGKV